MTRFKARKKHCAVMVSGWGTEDSPEEKTKQSTWAGGGHCRAPMWERVCKEGSQLFLECVDVIWFRLKLK